MNFFDPLKNQQPCFDTIAKVLHALGVQMTFTAKPPQTAENHKISPKTL